MTKFKADTTYQTKDKSSEDVFDEVKENMLSENLFSAVKISGVFKNARSHDAWTRAAIHTIN